MGRLDVRVKGSYQFLRSCGRAEQSFSPFNLDVPTTLRVKKDLDKVYDVKPGALSSDRRTPTTRMADKGHIGESMDPIAPQKDSEPGPGMYNPSESRKVVDNYGKTYIRIGGTAAGRVAGERPQTPADRIYEKKKEVFEAAILEKDEKAPLRTAPQKSFRPDKHVHGFAFGHAKHRPLQKRLEEDTHYVHVGRYRRKKKDRAPPRDAALQQAQTPSRTPHVPSGTRETGPGGFSNTKRRMLSRYYFNMGTFPAASEEVEMPAKVSDRFRAKHVPRVALGRTSGRARKNESKENAATLERMLKEVNAKQSKADRKVCLDSEAAGKEGCFRSKGKQQGVDLYLHGGRMEMAFQGAANTGGGEWENLPVRSIAAWAADEAESISRRVQSCAASRAGSPAAGAAQSPRASLSNPPVQSTISTSVHGLQHIRSKKVAAAAAMDLDATLRAVGDPDVQSPLTPEPIAAEEVAISFD